MHSAEPDPTPSVRHLLGRLAALMQVPVVVACVVLFVIQWDNQMDHARDDMRTTTTAIASALRERFSTIERRLDELAAAVPDAETPQALEHFHASALAAVHELGVDAIVLVRPDGRQVVNTRVPYGSPLPPSPATMLKPVRLGRPAVNDLALVPLGRVQAAGLGVPVLRDGRIAYGLNAGIEHTRFGKLLAGVSIPEGWSACIADGNRLVVAHRGGLKARQVGEPIPNLHAGPLTSGDHGPFETTEDGRPGQFFYRVSATSGWSSHVTVPDQVLYAPMRRAAAELALALTLVFLLSMGAATRVAGRISKSVERLGEAARRFPAVEGVVLPRHTFGEAREVAGALTESARTLEQSRDAGMRSEQRLQTILRTASSAIIVTDASHLVVSFNDSAETIFGRGRAQTLGTQAAGLFTARSWALMERACRGAGATAVRKPIPCAGVREDGRVFPGELLLSSFADADGTRYCTLIVRDVTERARDQRDLRLARDELRRVNDEFQRTLLREMDAQMAAVARELHDDVGSSLAGISLLAAGAKATDAAPAQRVELLEKIQHQVQHAAQKVRQVSRGIMPAGEEAGALVPALERLVQEAGAAAGIHCSFRWKGDFGTVPTSASGHAYRIVQEAIANALRHGQATCVRVTLARAGPRMRLSIADNGRGFDLARLRPAAAGIGLRSIRARAAAMDGEAVFGGAPGRGCRVSVSWTH